MTRAERIKILKKLKDETTSYEVIPGRYGTSEECPARNEIEKQALSDSIAEAEMMEKVAEGMPKKMECYDHPKPDTSNCETCDRYAFFNRAIDLCQANFVGRVGEEVCICAAIKLSDGYIARGHRHGDCIRHINEHYSYLKKEVIWLGHIQGFITSKNRFVTREEGGKLQDAAGIKSVDGYRGNTLFSEDLY